MKVFDGEKLTKRIQITFESAGHFNHFANKVRKWLNVTVLLLKTIADQLVQLATEQFTELLLQPRNVLQSSQLNSQIVVSPNCTQPLARNRQEAQETPLRTMQDSILLLLGAAQINTEQEIADFSQQMSQQNTSVVSQPSFSQPNYSMLSQSTQMWNTPATDLSVNRFGDDLQGMKLYQPVPQNTILPGFSVHSAWDGDTTYYERSGHQGTQYTSAPETFRRTRTKKHKVEKYFQKAMRHAFKSDHENYADLDDRELALKIARTLKKSSFVLFVKRVEKVLHDGDDTGMSD